MYGRRKTIVKCCKIMKSTIYKEINEEDIEEEINNFKKIQLYTCNRECQHFCIYYEEKNCVRCIPLEKGVVRLEVNNNKIL